MTFALPMRRERTADSTVSSGTPQFLIIIGCEDWTLPAIAAVTDSMGLSYYSIHAENKSELENFLLCLFLCMNQAQRKNATRSSSRKMLGDLLTITKKKMMERVLHRPSKVEDL
jgi:hypothetical protein